MHLPVGIVMDRQWRNRALTSAPPNPDWAISSGNAHKMKQTGTYTTAAPLGVRKVAYSLKGPGPPVQESSPDTGPVEP